MKCLRLLLLPIFWQTTIGCQIRSFTPAKVTDRKGAFVLEEALAEKKINSFDEFVSNPEAIEHYFAVSQSYFGKERFPRDGFDAILLQAKNLANIGDATSVELKKRLWEKFENPAEYLVSAGGASYGREMVKNGNISDYFAKLNEQLLALVFEGSNLPTSINLNGVSEEIFEAAHAVNKRVDEHTDRVKDLGKTQKGKENQRFFLELKADASVAAIAKRLAALAILETIAASNLFTLIQTKNPDLIIDAYSKLQDSAIAHLVAGQILLPGAKEFIVSLIPKTADFFNNTDLFTRTMRSAGHDLSDYEVGQSTGAGIRFYTAPRKFHAIFRGLMIKECTGGGNRPGHLDTLLSPTRWGAILVKGSRVDFAEKNGSEGFIEMTPLLNKVTGKYIASTTWSAPILKELEAPTIENNTVTFGRPIFLNWLEAVTPTLPDTWEGIGKSEDTQGINARVITEILQHPVYTAAPVHVTTTSLETEDGVFVNWMNNNHKIAGPRSSNSYTGVIPIQSDLTNSAARNVKLINTNLSSFTRTVAEVASFQKSNKKCSTVPLELLAPISGNIDPELQKFAQRCFLESDVWKSLERASEGAFVSKANLKGLQLLSTFSQSEGSFSADPSLFTVLIKRMQLISSLAKDLPNLNNPQVKAQVSGLILELQSKLTKFIASSGFSKPQISELLIVASELLEKYASEDGVAIQLGLEFKKLSQGDTESTKELSTRVKAAAAAPGAYSNGYLMHLAILEASARPQ